MKKRRWVMMINTNGIYFRKWAAGRAKAAVLAVHGMGAQSERFDDMAKFLKTKSISTYAIELRGYGELAQKPGYVKSMKLYHEDIAALKEIIKSENKGKPVFMLGESMGAVISHINILDYDKDYAGLVEIVPVYQDVMKISLLQRAAIAGSALFNPEKPILMPFKSEELSRDLGVVKRLNKDKREIKIASAGLLLNILLSQLRALGKPKGIKIPVLFLVAGKDLLGDTKFTLNFYNKLETDKEYKLYEGSYHALTIEKNRKEVFKDIFSWIEKKMGKEKP
jgi:alpha-beta hydrolase superfamily lysophospholipase